jgi:hypothetical protein
VHVVLSGLGLLRGYLAVGWCRKGGLSLHALFGRGSRLDHRVGLGPTVLAR